MRQKILKPEQIASISKVENPISRKVFALFYQLPDDLQQLMVAEETSKNVWSIVRDKNALVDENVKIVARVIGLVMLGEIHIKDLIKELVERLNIDSQKATTLAKDINQIIFQPVRESLMEVHGIKPASGVDSSSKYPLNSVRGKQVESSKEKKEAGPVSLEDLEKNSPTTPASFRAVPPIKDSVELSSDNHGASEAEDRRDALINKLKAEKQERESSFAKASEGQGDPSTTPVTTAWNGRTIDLKRIPPRRKKPTRKKTAKIIKIHEA